MERAERQYAINVTLFAMCGSPGMPMNEDTKTSERPHRDYTGSKLGMWLFLFTEVLLFGGLFLLYSVYRSMHSEDFHAAAQELSIVLGTANTVILLTSSLTVALSITAVRRNKIRAAAGFLIITILLGTAFLVDKYFEWAEHIRHGYYPNSAELLTKSHGTILFFGLYYVMTGLHGLHVLAGGVLLAIMLVSLLRGRIHSGDFVRLENSALFWHLVDIIWIYLFPLFYIIT